MPSPPKVRERKFYDFQGSSLRSSNYGSSWSSFNDQKVESGAQTTESIGHKKFPDGSYREGGPFYTCRVRYKFPTVPWDSRSQLPKYNYVVKCELGTPLADSHLPSGYPKHPTSFRSKDTSDLDKWGAKAISIVNPNNPNSELAVALGELTKEKLPNLPGRALWERKAKLYLGVSEELLNSTFGWLPLVSEVKDAAQSVRDSRTILETYQSNPNKPLHREFQFDPVESVETRTGLKGSAVNLQRTANFGGLPGSVQSVLPSAPLTQTIRKSSRIWFEGAFIHAAPSEHDSWKRLMIAGSEADKLFGTAITPQVLWELAPWSWAIDWFTNTGDVINNATAFALAGLVMRYGYVMEESIVEITNSFDTASMTENSFGSKKLYERIPPSSVQYRAKVRRPANPFGFGITYDGLSPLQWAIAGALGITRVF